MNGRRVEAQCLLHAGIEIRRFSQGVSSHVLVSTELLSNFFRELLKARTVFQKEEERHVVQRRGGIEAPEGQLAGDGDHVSDLWPGVGRRLVCWEKRLDVIRVLEVPARLDPLEDLLAQLVDEPSEREHDLPAHHDEGERGEDWIGSDEL